MKLNYFLIPLITILTGSLGSAFTSKGLADWYKVINLPLWTPPGSLIGLVWTILYILTTISAIIFWNLPKKPSNFSLVLGIFITNAILNIAWSYLFFTAHLIGPAIFEAGLLGLSVLALIYFIWPVSKIASILLIPYAAWVAFATFLSYSVWLLNK